MSMRESFAANLGRLCAAKPSIAAVCRDTSINRQQFSRYLSGAALPNDRNLKKICRYFDVDEAELFRDAEDVGPTTRPPADERLSWSHTALRDALKMVSSEARTSVEPGNYFAHFAHPHDPGSIMRSAMFVRRDGALSTFRRLTGFSEKRGSWWSHFNGDHKGVILERRHLLYFIALNALGNTEPTLMVMRWVPSSAVILGGHASILTPIGPTVTAAVVTPCPRGTSLRGAISGSHVYSVDSPEIEPLVIDTLTQQIDTLVKTVRRLDLGVKPVLEEAL